MSAPRRVVALGFFDGVHIGHAALLRTAAERAAERAALPAAVTFDIPPETRITGRPLPLLTQIGDRAVLMRRLGISDVIVLPFDEPMMKMPWNAFLPDLLIRDHGAVGIVAGHDFRFGHRSEGHAGNLSAQCAALGLTCDIVARVEYEGITVSATHIRRLVAQGEVERAALFLGRPYSLTLPIERGRGLGRKLGFPTINMPVPALLQAPARGVYFSRVLHNGQSRPAVTNVGVRPTVDADGGLVAESHLFGYSGGPHDEPASVQLLRFARPERRFDNLNDLRDQVVADIAQAQAFHRV